MSAFRAIVRPMVGSGRRWSAKTARREPGQRKQRLPRRPCCPRCFDEALRTGRYEAYELTDASERIWPELARNALREHCRTGRALARQEASGRWIVALMPAAGRYLEVQPWPCPYGGAEGHPAPFPLSA